MRVVVPSRFITAQGPRARTGVDPRHYAAFTVALVKRYEELFPGVADTTETNYWTGLRPSTPSNVPKTVAWRRSHSPAARTGGAPVASATLPRRPPAAAKRTSAPVLPGGTTTARYVVGNPAEQVVSYTVPASTLVKPRDNGLSEFEAEIPDGG